MRNLFPSMLVTVPVNAAGFVTMAVLLFQQIWVPSAKRMNWPLAFDPRSITAPVGVPLDSLTVPTAVAVV